jgi:hypothetical protein
MSARTVSIAQVMMVIALAAVNLAIARTIPREVATVPFVWMLIAIIDWVILRKLVQRASLRGFEYTFPIVLVITFQVMANLWAADSFLPLTLLLRCYYQLMPHWVGFVLPFGTPQSFEIGMVALLSFSPALAAGVIGAWLEGRLGWDVAAFWRGSLLGVLVAGVLLSTYDAGWAAIGRPQRGDQRKAPRLIVLAVCVSAGGRLGLVRLRSRRAS